jgi:hypothetical protein
MLGGLLVVPTFVLARPTLSDAELDAISAAGDICQDFFGISGSCVVSVSQVFQSTASPVVITSNNPVTINNTVVGTPQVPVTKTTAKPTPPNPGPIKQVVTVPAVHSTSFTTVHQKN